MDCVVSQSIVQNEFNDVLLASRLRFMPSLELVGPGTDIEWYQLDEEQYMSLKEDPSSIRDQLDELELSNESGAFVDEGTTLCLDGQPLFSLEDSHSSATKAAPHFTVEETQLNIGEEGGPYLVRLVPAEGTWLRLELEQDFDIAKLMSCVEQKTYLGTEGAYCVGKIISSLNYADWEEGEFEFESTVSTGESFLLIDKRGHVEELDLG